MSTAPIVVEPKIYILYALDIIWCALNEVYVIYSKKSTRNFREIWKLSSYEEKLNEEKELVKIYMVSLRI